MYVRIIKPSIDFILSIIGFIVLSPIFLILCIWIKCDSKGPIFFKQKRFGKDKKFFYIYKFRTMYTDTPKDMPTHLLSNPEQYITKSGKFLRKTSLDELPQIINIIKGEMAIIGPRPALWNQEDLMQERDKYGANALKPGLTGWAQINGRKDVEWHHRIELNVWYVRNISFFLDVKIFFMTIIKVLRNDDNENVGETVINNGDK